MPCRHRLGALALLALIVAACQDGAGPGAGGAGLTILSGGSGSDTIGAVLSHPLIVQLRDQSGRPAPGVEVVFTTPSDSAGQLRLMLRKQPLLGFAQSVRDTTDESGEASATVGLGYIAGPGTVIASVSGPGTQVTGSYLVLPGAPVAIRVSPRDRPVYVGGSYPIGATLIDRSGNPVAGTPVFSTNSGTIQVSGAGNVQGTVIGRGRIGIRIGGFVDSAFASVVPRGVLAFFAIGQFVGDSERFARSELDGSDFRSITATGITPSEYSPSNEMAPRWIAGTSELVHARLVNGAPRLFVAGSDGSLRRLISQPYAALREDEADYSPTDAWIYYVGTDTLGIQAIWRVASTGGTPEQVTAPGDGNEFRSPGISPDGSALVYVSRMYGWEQFHAYVRVLATGVVTPLGPNEAAGTEWSPTGSWILYALSGPYAGYSGQLHVVHPDGTGDRVLIDGAYFPGGTWSSDGAYVVGVRADLPYMGLELIDVAAGTRLPLIYPNASWYGPTWLR
jgi:hypothetical protein